MMMGIVMKTMMIKTTMMMIMMILLESGEKQICNNYLAFWVG